MIKNISTKLICDHNPVLLKEVVNMLVTKDNGVYIDATFGCGGHSKSILDKLGNDGVLLCVDRDRDAINIAEKINDKRLIIKHGSFINLKQWLINLGYYGKIDGILLDLGVSSMQLDNPIKGFSFLNDGPLDMRMNIEDKISASLWINSAKEKDIAYILRKYGEEKSSKSIARAIVKERIINPINTTKHLANIVSIAQKRWDKKKHPATRTFQAIRIFINNELDDLSTFLEQTYDILNIHGRLVIISFHSLEDRIIKNFLQKQNKGGFPERLPIYDYQLIKKFRFVEQIIRPSLEEIKNNPRSRSAKLRVVEKI